MNQARKLKVLKGDGGETPKNNICGERKALNPTPGEDMMTSKGRLRPLFFSFLLVRP